MNMRSITRKSKWAVLLAPICFLLGSISFAIPASADTIKIGAPIPITGPYSSDGQVMEKGQILAIEEINQQGGLLGEKVEYIMFDIGDLTPDKLQAAATNLIERQNVDVLINGYGGMGPDIPAFCPYELPYIHNDATSNVVELVRNMNCKSNFMSSDYDINYGRITFEQLMDLDYEYPNKKWAIIQGPYDWELNAPKGAEEVAEQRGWEVVVREQVPYEIKQWGGILSKLRETNPALIYLELLEPAAVKTFIDQFQENPPKQSLLYIGYTISVPAFSEVVNRGAADGVLGMTLSAQMPNAKGREFAAKWKRKYNEDPPFSIAAQIYDEVMLWATAVRKVGSARDFAAISEALRNMTYEGITGTYKFNEAQYIPTSDDTIPTHLLQVQGSEVKQVRIGTKKQSDFRMPPWIE